MRDVLGFLALCAVLWLLILGPVEVAHQLNAAWHALIQ